MHISDHMREHWKTWLLCIRIDKDVSEHLRNFSHLFISSGTNAADVNLSRVTKTEGRLVRKKETNESNEYQFV